MSDDTLIDVALGETRDKMHRAVEHAKGEFSTVRTGRASPVLVEKLKVDYFGSDVPLQQIAGLTVAEARVLVINPYDKSAIKAIEKAIQTSDLGVNPSNDGALIRISFPPLTEERRKDLIKVVRQRAEDSCVAVRNVRRAARHELEALEKAGDISSDELRAQRGCARQADPRARQRDRPAPHPQRAGATRGVSRWAAAHLVRLDRRRGQLKWNETRNERATRRSATTRPIGADHRRASHRRTRGGRGRRASRPRQTVGRHRLRTEGRRRARSGRRRGHPGLRVAGLGRPSDRPGPTRPARRSRRPEHNEPIVRGPSWREDASDWDEAVDLSLLAPDDDELAQIAGAGTEATESPFSFAFVAEGRRSTSFR